MRSPGLSSPRMTVCKVSLALLSSLLSVAAGDASLHSPWFLEFGYDNLKHGTEPIPSFKKIPNEDKAFKKPVYALDAEELLLKSGSAYCQEIQLKDSESGSAQKQKQKQPRPSTCYRCKDPSNGSVYEHCSYSSPAPASGPQPRSARSNGLAEHSLDSLGAPSSRSAGSSDKLPDSFRFSEDYFSPQASEDLPAEYERNVDNCERIVKDSMVCMLCKDPKSNGKYEQCSYVAQPNEKAYAYTKSSSFGGAAAKPRSQALKAAEAAEAAEAPEDEGPELTHLHFEHEPGSSAEEREEAHHSHYVPEHSYHYPSYKGYSGEAAEAAEAGSYELEGEDARSAAPSQRVKSKAGCRSVQKDGQSCRVCVEPKTGAESEKCNYSHEPKDKVYKYTKSKSFGYPDSSPESEKADGSQTSRRAAGRRPSSAPRTPRPDSSEKQERERSAEDYGYGSYHGEPSSLDYIRSESEKISKKVKGSGDCRQEKRDSMLCTVCKDPKTGGDFEQCNYSFEPKDKVFAYSKSKHFGSPSKAASEEEEYSGPGSSEEPAEEHSQEHSQEHTQETYSLPVIYPTGTSPLDYIPKSSESHLSSVYASQKPQDKSRQDSKVDHGFYDATVRRAEIEKIVKDIGSSGTEDRSKCKMMFRGGMTCYRCTDDKGFTNEECVFVNEPERQLSKEQQKMQTTDAVTALEVTIKPTLHTPSPTTKLLEPMASASWQTLASQRKIRQAKEEGDDEGDQQQQQQQQQQRQQQQQQQRTKDKDEELEVLDEERDEAEPYDYVAETRPVYDKVLGITLPAYMVHKSPHEIEFDQMVENAKF